MTTYILESAVCLACLYGFYYAFLRRETFFQWNRVFLLLAPLLSLLFPALNIPLICPTADSPESALVASPIADLPNLVEQAQVAPQRVEYRLNLPLQEGWSLSLGEAIWYLYLVGMSVLMIRLIVRLAALYRLIKRCKTTHQEPAYTVLSGENAPTFQPPPLTSATIRLVDGSRGFMT